MPDIKASTVFRDWPAVPFIKAGDQIAVQCPDCKRDTVLTNNSFLNCSRCGTRMVAMRVVAKENAK